jgi:hypothetical protein
MAINVNEVYQTVLLILNKEQRGYMTPDEFNKIATQVQLEIFEKFFEDYNQYIRMPKTDVEFASRMDHIREEFQVFEVTADASAVVALSNVYTQPSGLHRFGSAFYTTGKNSPEIEIVSSRDYHQLRLSPLTQPNTNFPVATYQGDKLTVYPQTANPLVSDISFNYIRKPANVVWAFTVGSLGQYIYDSGVASTDFEISDSQQTEVILKILQYAGIVIRDPNITQAAAQELAQDEANIKR